MIEPVGSVLSTRIVIAAEVKALPALSVVTTRRSYWPSATQGGVQARRLVRPGAEADRGALELDGVDAASRDVGRVARERDRAADVRAAAGLVTEPVGSVLSTRTVVAPEVKALPALSVVTTRRS